MPHQEMEMSPELPPPHQLEKPLSPETYPPIDTEPQSVIAPQGAIFTLKEEKGAPPTIPFAFYGDLLYDRNLPPTKKLARFRKVFTKTHMEEPIGAHKKDPELPKGLEKIAEGIPTLRDEARPFTLQPLTPDVREIYDITSDSVITVSGFSSTSTNEKNWFFIFPERSYKLDRLQQPVELNGAAEALSKRQAKSSLPMEQATPKTPSQKRQEYHQDILLCLLANGDVLVPQFYRDQPELSQSIRSWYEVYLNDYGLIFQRGDKTFESHIPCGQADIIYEGPDTQGIEIEIGAPTPRKVEQTKKHTAGLRALIQDVNHGNASPPITSFIASFWKVEEQDEWIVHFRSPEEITSLPY